MSAIDTAQISPIVSSTSAGPARTSPSAVLTARFPSQASVQVNQTAAVLAEISVLQRVDPTKDWAGILLQAAEMNVNPLNGVMDTPEARRGLFDYVTKPVYEYRALVTVDLPMPHLWQGCKIQASVYYMCKRHMSHTDATNGLLCYNVNMRILLKHQYLNVPEDYAGPYADQLLRWDTDNLHLKFCPEVVGKTWYLKTPEFCTNNFFKCHTARSLTVDNVWNTYDDLCRKLLSLQRNGLCQHIWDHFFCGPVSDNFYTGCHVLKVCGHQAWFKGCCYCVNCQHAVVLKKRRRIDED